MLPIQVNLQNNETQLGMVLNSMCATFPSIIIDSNHSINYKNIAYITSNHKKNKANNQNKANDHNIYLINSTLIILFFKQISCYMSSFNTSCFLTIYFSCLLMY